MNKVTLIGRLTRDAEIKFVKDKMVISFTLAVDREYIGKDGERATDFIPVSYWTQNAEKLIGYLTKGRLIGVNGSIRVRKYEKEDGNVLYYTEISTGEIQFLDSRKENVL